MAVGGKYGEIDFDPATRRDASVGGDSLASLPDHVRVLVVDNGPIAVNRESIQQFRFAGNDIAPVANGGLAGYALGHHTADAQVKFGMWPMAQRRLTRLNRAPIQ